MRYASMQLVYKLYSSCENRRRGPGPDRLAALEVKGSTEPASAPGSCPPPLLPPLFADHSRGRQTLSNVRVHSGRRSGGHWQAKWE